MLVHHVVDEVTRGDGQGEAAAAINDDEQKTAEEEPAARPDELPYLGHDLLHLRLGTRRGEVGRCGFAHAARGAICGLHAAAEIGWAKGRRHFLYQFYADGRAIPYA